MKEENVLELSRNSFFEYGTFANLINPDTARLGKKPIEFFRDMLSVKLGTTGIASFSVCRVEKRPFIVDIIEYHNSTGEGILPLDGDILIHVAVATPENEIPADKIKVFRVPKGTMVSLNPGIWHHAPFADKNNAVNVMVVLPERTYANDCVAHPLPKAKQVRIKIR